MAHSMMSLAIVFVAVIFSEECASDQFIAGAIEEVPAEDSPRNAVEYTSGYVRTKGIKVFYRSAVSPTKGEPKLPVLLLHAARYTSRKWKDLGTLRVLAAAGYHAVAVDLPGYGKTKKRYKGNKSDFLLELIQDLGIERPVLVSPSMSGVYSIPFVLKHYDELRGYVPIAPTNSRGTSRKFSRIDLPALIIFGTWDTHGKRMSQMIAHIPGSQVEPISWASHHAYVDFRNTWHKLLKEFLGEIWNEEQAALKMYGEA